MDWIGMRYTIFETNLHDGLHWGIIVGMFGLGSMISHGFPERRTDDLLKPMVTWAYPIDILRTGAECLAFGGGQVGTKNIKKPCCEAKV